MSKALARPRGGLELRRRNVLVSFRDALTMRPDELTTLLFAKDPRGQVPGRGSQTSLKEVN